MPHLPAGWRQSLGHLTDVVRRRRVAEAWNEAPGDVWNALMSLQRNALRLSVIVHLLLAGRPVDRKPEKKKGHDAGILQQVTAAGGSGELVGKVRGHRRALRGSVLWPRFQDGHVWTETADRIAHFARMGEGLAGHLGAETADERLCTMSRCLAHMIHTVGKADAGDDGLDGRERATAFRHLMGMLDAALDDEAWFPGTDTETGAALFLDPRSDAAERFPAGTMPSLFGTRADFLWQGLDAAHDLRRAMMGQRYYDGYAFLAGMVDLRNAGRDQHRPAFRVPVVEAILQILVWSAEGLVAQLKLALHAAGRSDLADNLPLSRLVLALPEGFPAATPDQVGRVLPFHGDDAIRPRQRIREAPLGIALEGRAPVLGVLEGHGAIPRKPLSRAKVRALRHPAQRIHVPPPLCLEVIRFRPIVNHRHGMDVLRRQPESTVHHLGGRVVVAAQPDAPSRVCHGSGRRSRRWVEPCRADS